MIETVRLVEVVPTKIWIESDLMGGRHVVVHHKGHGEPFTYASFHYDYAYTDNATTWDNAHRLTLSLGATEPVETRNRGLTFPSPAELRQQIADMQSHLQALEGGDPPTA